MESESKGEKGNLKEPVFLFEAPGWGFMA